MRKCRLFLVVTILLISVVALTGCGGRGGDENLVGTWNWDADAGYRYVFNADGTGSRGFAGAIQTFRWSASNDVLSIGAERWNYTISGDVLTIDSRQAQGLTFSYIRQGGSGNQQAETPTNGDITDGTTSATEDFVGTWAWDMDNSFEYIFNADGTGSRGFGNDTETFTWVTADNNELRINRDNAPAGEIANERWTYSFAGDVLTIDSLQATGLRFSYIRQ
jgi:hypothetical protein